MTVGRRLDPNRLARRAPRPRMLVKVSICVGAHVYVLCVPRSSTAFRICGGNTVQCVALQCPFARPVPFACLLCEQLLP